MPFAINSSIIIVVHAHYTHRPKYIDISSTDSYTASQAGWPRGTAGRPVDRQRRDRDGNRRSGSRSEELDAGGVDKHPRLPVAATAADSATDAPRRRSVDGGEQSALRRRH